MSILQRGAKQVRYEDPDWNPKGAAMTNPNLTRAVLLGCVLLLGANCAWAQDWPQWRGPNRDNKVTGFTEPKTWPKELTQKWKVPVGLGESSPVLVGEKLYVFGRQGGDEVTLCLDAGSGKELWRDKYEAVAVKGAAKGHPGPRSTPAVAEGKVCTLGVGGVVSCLDAASGKVLWRKDTKEKPQFYTSSSPLIVDGKCIVYVGVLTAYDLANGDVKWTLPGFETPYGSPVLMTVDGMKQIVTPTAGALVGTSLAGKLLWQVKVPGKYDNNMGTPVIDGQTVYFTGPTNGAIAIKIEKKGDGFAAEELYKKGAAAHKYSTPVLKDGLLYGLAGAGKTSAFYCMDAKTGDKLWTDKTPRGECGHILEAGSVLLAVTSDTQLVVFQPSNKQYQEVASYKVADKGGAEGPWSCPIISGNRIFVKDKGGSLTLWTID
jgi:outer membrane protein assembly factor BamB